MPPQPNTISKANRILFAHISQASRTAPAGKRSATHRNRHIASTSHLPRRQPRTHGKTLANRLNCLHPARIGSHVMAPAAISQCSVTQHRQNPEAAPQNRQQPPQSSFPQVAICRWFFPYSGYSLMFVRLALSTSVACMVSNTPVPYRKGCPTAHRRASPPCPLTLRSLVRFTETKQRRLLRTKQTRTRRN